MLTKSDIRVQEQGKRGNDWMGSEIEDKYDKQDVKIKENAKLVSEKRGADEKVVG